MNTGEVVMIVVGSIIGLIILIAFIAIVRTAYIDRSVRKRERQAILAATMGYVNPYNAI